MWVEFADFDPDLTEPRMTKTTMPGAELLQQHDDGDFLRAVAESVLQLIMEADVRPNASALSSFCRSANKQTAASSPNGR